MNAQYDVIVVGAGISGCFAALKAAEQGARILIVEQEVLSAERPFVEFLLIQDFKHLGLDRSKGYFFNQGFSVCTGSKISYEVDMPEGYGYVYMEGNLLLSKLLQMVQQRNAITLRNSTRVMSLIEEEGQYKGVEISSGEKLYSKITILCTGLNSTTHFNIKATDRWPGFFDKYKQKIKVTTQIHADHNTISQRFHSKTHEFYLKGLFGNYLLYPFDEYVVYEACLPDISEVEAIKQLENFHRVNPIAKELLKDFDLSNLGYHTQVFTEFGVRLPTYFPGLLIAGDAMNLTGPAYLYSLYSSIHTGIWAGEVASKVSEQNTADHVLLSDYEEVWMQNLIQLEKDFEIMNHSSDQFEAMGNWLNAFIEDFDQYFLEIKI